MALEQEVEEFYVVVENPIFLEGLIGNHQRIFLESAEGMGIFGCEFLFAS